MSNLYKFYDTCSLLMQANHLFPTGEYRLVISSVTLQELEAIKTSAHKDPEIKFSARQLLRMLDENVGEYDVHIFTNDMLAPLEEKNFLINDDLRILATAIDYDTNVHPDETVFVTNDLALKNIANMFFGEDSIESIYEDTVDGYTGYKEIVVNDDQFLSEFYQNLERNHFDLFRNEYLLLKNPEGEVIDRLCWTGETHRRLAIKEFKSRQFGAVSPMKGDNYQLLAADSLCNNQITMLCGKPGSGKTYLAFGYLFSQLEKHQIDRIVVFCNPVVAKNAAKLGFYPGTVLEKLMSSQVGAVLSSKLGDSFEVERLVTEGRLVLIPAGDARGYEVPARSGVYIMESQNLTCDLLRMLLQRISEDCKVIVDGDYNEQVDMDIYSGNNNGMRKMSKVFRGEEMFGQIELKSIHRSRIAAIADKMK